MKVIVEVGLYNVSQTPLNEDRAMVIGMGVNVCVRRQA